MNPTAAWLVTKLVIEIEWTEPITRHWRVLGDGHTDGHMVPYPQMPSEELPGRGGGNGGKREEGGEGDEEGQERRKKEEQQSGMLSCFSITLPSIRWGTVPSHLTQLLCRH